MAEKICVTGGRGFIGTHLVAKLHAQGHDVSVFDYPAKDLRAPLKAMFFISDHEPQVVYHLAAQAVVTSRDDLTTLETNIQGTYNLLHACLYCPSIRSIVHISTDKVYGSNENACTDSPLIGVNHPYNASKLCGDVIAQMYSDYYDLPIRIIRTGNIYGGGDMHTDRLIPEAILSTLEGKRLAMRSDGSFVRDYIYIEDLIPAYLRIADSPKGIYNLGGHSFTAMEVVEQVLSLMDRPDLVPVIRNSQHNEIPKQHVVDCPDWWDKEPKHSLREGLKKTIAWYRKYYSELAKQLVTL